MKQLLSIIFEPKNGFTLVLHLKYSGFKALLMGKVQVLFVLGYFSNDVIDLKMTLCMLMLPLALDSPVYCLPKEIIQQEGVGWGEENVGRCEGGGSGLVGGEREEGVGWWEVRGRREWDGGR